MLSKKEYFADIEINKCIIVDTDEKTGAITIRNQTFDEWRDKKVALILASGNKADIMAIRIR
jgi:hypothetical protein